MDNLNFIKLSFNLDPAGELFAIITAVLAILIFIFKLGYSRYNENANQKLNIVPLVISIICALGISFAANLAVYFACNLIMTLAAFWLVMKSKLYSETHVGRKFIIYILAADILFFAGIFIVFSETGELEFTPGGFVGDANMPFPLMLTAFLLMAMSGAVKAGMIPMHSWLTSASVSCSSPDMIFINLTVVNSGAFSILRIIGYVFGPEMSQACYGSTIIAVLAICNMIVAPLVGIGSDNIESKTTYAMTGQISCIILGICIMTPYSYTGAIYYMVAHLLVKSVLLMASSTIASGAGSYNIKNLVGAGRELPYTKTIITLASVAAVGLPPFAGFIANANIITGAIQTGKVAYIIVLIVSAVLTAMCLVPTVLCISRKDSENLMLNTKKDANAAMIIPMAIVIIIIIALGVVPNIGLGMYNLAVNAANSIFTPFI